jgi:hypothetical protein
VVLLAPVDICPRCRSLACRGDVLLECRGALFDLVASIELAARERRVAFELELRRRDRVGRPTPNQWNQQNGAVA